MSNSCEAVVIGAGLAGLGAAATLKSAGVRVAALEARARVGGRVFSKSFRDGHVELGALLIHGTQASILRIAREKGIRVGPLGAGMILPQKIKPLSFLFRKSLRDFVLSFATLRNAYVGSPEMRSQPFSELLRKARIRNAFVESLARFLGAHPDVIASRMVMEDFVSWLNTDLNWWVKPYYSKVPETIAAELEKELLFESVVERIEWKRGKVVVSYRRGDSQEQCDALYCICTLPLGVLKANSVEFAPSLPEWKTKAIRALPVSDFCFFHVGWKNPKYVAKLPPPDQLKSIMYPHSDCGYLRVRLEAPILSLLRNRSRKKVPHEVLGKIFGSRGFPDVEIFDFHDWGTDPFSMGSVCYTSPAIKGERHLLGLPVKGTLFFAGEATAGKSGYATVHGAFDSGIRAANEVLADSGRTPTNKELGWF